MNYVNFTEHHYSPKSLLLVAGGGIITFLALFIALLFLSIYFLHRGAERLNYVFNSQIHMPNIGLYCAVTPDFDSARKEILDQAISNLGRSISFYRNNPHIKLLLGRAYCLSGDYANAIQSLQYYVDRKPNNPIGHLELGYAYRQANEFDKANYHWSKAGINDDEHGKINMMEWKDDDLSGEYSHYLILDSFVTAESWLPYTSNSSGEISTNDGLIVISYMNNIDRRDIFGFSYSTQTSISTFSRLLIRMRGEPGTLVTIETIIDGERERELNYQPVLDEWVIEEIPIQGDTLYGISIGIGEPNATSIVDNYELTLDWIVLQ